jgi:hypothetical protein
MTGAFDYPCVAALCEKALSFVGEELISAKYREKLMHFASMMPQKLSFQYFGFECPLYSEESWGDILFHIDLLNETSIHDLSTLPTPWQESLGWNRLSKFAKACYEQNLFSKDLKGIDHWICTEFDVGSSSNSPYTPSIFLHTSKLRGEALSRTIRKCTPFLEVSDSTLSNTKMFRFAYRGS